MKLFLMTALVLFSVTASAYSRFDDVDEKSCPEMNISSDNDIAYCKASNAKEVMKAKVGKNLTVAEQKALGFHTYGAVDIGLVPDDSSDTAYFYTRWLLSSAGKRVGVLTIEGWYNTEMETSARFDIRYNLKGEIVMISEKPM